MSRQKVEVRREEILDAAVEEVQRLGFASTRVTDVAAALGVSSGLIFYHFGTKEKLLAAALEHAVERDLARLERTVAKAKDPLDAVRRVLALYSPQGNAPGWTIWVDAWAESLRSTDMRTASRDLDLRWKDVLAAQIRQGVSDGLFTCPDPDGSAWRLSSLLDGLAVQVLVHRTLTKRQLAEWVRIAAAAELGITPSALS
ncbi:MAG TPA: TetR/AcrR family transcriptional regulator [Candidatus Nanopelagicales bacterium]